MPGTSIAKHPTGVEIEFNEQAHSYKSVINGKEFKYVSGTTFIGQFFKPFDETGTITKKCAEREGISVEEMKARWAEKGRKSCYYGTRLHETCEDVLLQRDFRNKPEDEIEKKRFENGIRIARNILNKFDVIGIEKIVFSYKLPTPIAGTIDLLCRSKKDGTYFIFDWKTNANIDIENKYNSFALEPIQHIPDTSFYHYALQLSLYQFLLMHEKYVPRDAKFGRALLHVTENESDIMKVPDLTSDIKDMIIENAHKKVIELTEINSLE